MLALPGVISLHAQAFTARDSAGVRITVSAAPAWVEADAWQLSREPLVTLGGAAAPEGQDLWRVGGYVRADDGRLAVLSAGHAAVRIYDRDGSFLRSVGQAGQGPGEFMLLPPIGNITLVPPDTFVVMDGEGLDTFLLDGTFVDSKRLDRQPGVLRPGTRLVPFMLTATRSVYSTVQRYRPDSRPVSGTFRLDQGYALQAGPDEPPQLLGWYAGLVQELVPVGSGVMPVVTPFARHTTQALGLSAEPSFYVADSDRPEVQVFDQRGQLNAIIRWTRPSVAVRDAWVEAWKDQQRAQDWGGTPLPTMERLWREMDVPATLPSLAALAGDAEGFLWVLQPAPTDAEAHVYDVFNPAGQLLGAVSVPAGIVHTINLAPAIGPNYFMGVWKDEFDVESVRVYELDRRR